MTLPASARPFGDRLPSATEKAAANQLRQVIAAKAGGGARLRVLDEGSSEATEIVLTPALSGVLMELLRHISNGDAVTLVPVSKQLTTQQAADILNVSRPHLISLLERGDVPYTMTGRHRRITADQLFAYKKRRDEKRAAALADLAALDADLL